MSERPESETPRTADDVPRRWHPGDLTPEERVARMIRVDQAGEYGARRIYEGQLAVMGTRHPKSNVIRHMYEQEKRHLETFDRLLVERRVRPTLLQPFWHVAGFALGAATAAMGDKAAMACTVAVEEVIDRHYARQAVELGDNDAALKSTIEDFRAEELEHRDTGLEHGAEETVGYGPLSGGIKLASRMAIWLSERL